MATPHFVHSSVDGCLFPLFGTYKYAAMNMCVCLSEHMLPFLLDIYLTVELLGGSVSKESTCNAGDLGPVPGMGRFLEEGTANH